MQVTIYTTRKPFFVMDTSIPFDYRVKRKKTTLSWMLQKQWMKTKVYLGIASSYKTYTMNMVDVFSKENALSIMEQWPSG